MTTIIASASVTVDDSIGMKVPAMFQKKLQDVNPQHFARVVQQRRRRIHIVREQLP
jgi:hypothetical protein